MNLLLFAAIAQFIAPFAYASVDCSYQSASGSKEKIEIHLLGAEFEILQLRFSGPKADEYYSLQGHSKPDGTTKEFVQFATRASRGEPLKLKVNSKSKFFYTLLKGGNQYEWKPNPKTSIRIECTDR